MSNRSSTIAKNAGVSVGNRVFGSHTKAWGSIGAIVSMLYADALFAVTTGIVTGETEGAEILDENGRTVIGHAISPNLSKRVEAMAPAWEMFGLFKLDVPVICAKNTAGGTGFPNVTVVDDPLGTLGHTVVRKNGQIHLGTVTALEVPVHVRAPGTDIVQDFYGLLEVTSVPGSKFADESSGGQAVYLENGDILGLIVGGIEDRSIIAPLVGLIHQYDLALADDKCINRHNKIIDRLNQTQPSDREIASELPVYFGQFEALNNFVQKITKTPMFYRSSERIV